jgi:cysteine-rich repeat protein
MAMNLARGYWTAEVRVPSWRHSLHNHVAILLIVSSGVFLSPARSTAQQVTCVCGGAYEVGQRVRSTVDSPDGNVEIEIGHAGTVKGGSDPYILVEWDGITTGHDGNGFCTCPSGCSATPPLGWYVACSDIVPMCGDTVIDPGEQCDDGNTADGDCCSSTCQLPTGCKTAGKSLLLLKNDASDDSKDKLTWKWLKGPATALGELGDPTSTTNYTLCLYAGTSTASVAIPAGSNWQAAGSKGFKFKDPSGTPNGAQKALLKSGDTGKSKALVKGKGTNLPDTLVPALSLPVTAQLVNDANSTCFEAVYNSGDVIKNDSKQFKAKN